MNMRVEREKVASGVQRRDGSRGAAGAELKNELFPRLPGSCVDVLQESTIEFKERSDPLWEGKDYVLVWVGLKHPLAQVLSEYDGALGVAGGAEAALLAGEGDELRVVALLTAGSHTAMGQDAAVEIGVESGWHLVAQGAVLALEVVLPAARKLLPAVGDKPIQRRRLRLAARVGP